MSYVNNVASAATDFDFRIFAYISYRFCWIDKTSIKGNAKNPLVTL